MNPYQFFQPQPQFQMQPQTQNIQQANGFVNVPNETVARNYPIAYGTSVTFKDENAPYIYTKTMGFSQLDAPKFEKYKLIKEDSGAPSEIDLIWKEIKNLKSTVEDLKHEQHDSNVSAITSEPDAGSKSEVQSSPKS